MSVHLRRLFEQIGLRELYGRRYVVSGLSFDPSGGLLGTTSAGEACSPFHDVFLPAFPLTFAANSDTYLSCDLNLGGLVVRPLANGAPTPTFFSWEVPLWKIVTNATNIVGSPVSLRPTQPFPAGAQTVDFVPTPDAVEGAVQSHVGSVYVRTAGAALVRAMLGVNRVGDTATLTLRRFSNSVDVGTLVKTTQGWGFVEALSLTFPAVGWYDVLLKGNALESLSWCRGGQIVF